MSQEGRNYTLRIWRQKNRNTAGKLVDYKVTNISPGSSFLEMLDLLNEELVSRGEEAIAFDNDCREGICGMCSLVVNGTPHGHDKLTTVCQLHMRRFKDGETQVGYTQGFSPSRPGFFFFPADPDGNNKRIFVVNAATSDVRFV